MATAPTLPPRRPEAAARPADAPETIDFDRYIDQRVRETRAAVKATDLAVCVAKLIAAGLVLLLVAAVVEHWFVPGGFGPAERFGIFAVAAVGGLLYTAGRIAPLLARRVNPLYAASEIERDAPTLKNTLVNALQLRSAGATPEGVRRTLERQAAERLATADEATLDRGPLVRIGYVLLALVGLIGLYVVFSPKDLFATAARVAAPWADIAAPTRVRIDDLQPGAVTVSQGDSIEVSARLTGLREDESVEVVFSTLDGRTIDRRLPLSVDESGARHRATLPAAGGLGLQTDIRYRIAAGDARSRAYEVKVWAKPTIAPQRLEFDYPDYTGFADRTVESGGDIAAIEGTRITLTAEANLPIDAAQIDLDADGRPDVRMKAQGTEATGRITLRRDADAGAAPRDSVYVLRFTSVDGRANNDPARYRLSVTPDLRPEAAILAPAEPKLDVRPRQRVDIAVEARDPDFALAEARLLGEAGGRRVLDRALLDARVDGPHRGRFTATAAITPERLGLKPGDVLSYWVEAADNRTPKPNRVATERKRLRVIGGGDERRGDPGDGGSPDDAGGGQPNQGPPGDDGGEPSPDGGAGEAGEAGGSADQRAGEAPDAGDQAREDSADSGEQPGGGEQQPGAAPPEQPDQSGAAEQGSPIEAQPPQAEDGEQGGRQQQDGLRGAGDEDRSATPGESENGAAGQSGGPQDGEQGDSANNSPAGGQGQGQRSPGQPTGGPQQPVARDGSDDGEAFQRIQDHLAERDRANRRRDATPADGDGQPSESQAEDRVDGDPNDGRFESSDGRPGEAGAERRERDGAGETPDRGAASRRPEGGAPGEQRDSATSDAGAAGQDDSSTDSKETSDPREGTGDAGQNQAADEGAGQAADRGAGDQSGRPGEQQLADDPTGQSSGDQRGAGTESRPGDSGNREADGGDPGGEPDTGQPGDVGGGEPADSSPGEPGGEAAGGAASEGAADGPRGDPAPQEGARPGGGRSDPSEAGEPTSDTPRDDREGADPSGQAGQAARGADRGERPEAETAADGSEPGGDEANLEFARRQTDLVLERLSDQFERGGADEELLDSLGWTEDDLRRFLSRWRGRQDRAAAGAEGETELDAALRSLGLGRGGPATTGTAERDQLRDLRQRGRAPAPPALRDRLRSYNRAIGAERRAEDN